MVSSLDEKFFKRVGWFKLVLYVWCGSFVQSLGRASEFFFGKTLMMFETIAVNYCAIYLEWRFFFFIRFFPLIMRSHSSSCSGSL